MGQWTHHHWLNGLSIICTSCTPSPQTLTTLSCGNIEMICWISVWFGSSSLSRYPCREWWGPNTVSAEPTTSESPPSPTTHCSPSAYKEASGTEKPAYPLIQIYWVRIYCSWTVQMTERLGSAMFLEWWCTLFLLLLYWCVFISCTVSIYVIFCILYF